MFLNIDLKLFRAGFLTLNYKSDGKRQISMSKSKFLALNLKDVECIIKIPLEWVKRFVKPT